MHWFMESALGFEEAPPLVLKVYLARIESRSDLRLERADGRLLVRFAADRFGFGSVSGMRLRLLGTSQPSLGCREVLPIHRRGNRWVVCEFFDRWVGSNRRW